MAKIAEWYSVGDRSQMTVEKLLVILENMYRDLAIAMNKKPDVYQRTTDGLVSDVALNNGDLNININTNKVQMLTAHPTASTVTWTTLS